MMTEQQIQTKRIKQLEADGYYVIKLIVTNKNGIPDLLALKQGAVPLFVEVKKPNGKVSKLQKYRLDEIRRLGFHADVYRGDG
jgi:Holliday junction resolvase